MFVIVSYDVEEKKCVKVMKVLRKYLFHQQKSVFVGNITNADLRELKAKLASIIDTHTDSVIIFEQLSDKYVIKCDLGLTKNLNIVI
ncbi:MAG TPA: CRISPR-associated endonuclease Cas2 [Bacilli bacterium]|nr:CRISPR-associated endonuclease Cas2 [Bacilli bacterium]